MITVSAKTACKCIVNIQLWQSRCRNIFYSIPQSKWYNLSKGRDTLPVIDGNVSQDRQKLKFLWKKHCLAIAVLQMMAAYLKESEGFVQRARVRSALRQCDPLAAAARWSKTVSRRVYRTSMPNSLWHLDSHMKLIRCVVMEIIFMSTPSYNNEVRIKPHFASWEAGETINLSFTINFVTKR